MRTTPLETSVLARGALLADDAGWRMPLSYGDRDAEVGSVRARAGVVDLSSWGHFTLDGKNGVKFLQGLVTNDVAALSAGTGCWAAFLNVNGRIQAVAHVFSFGENRLFLQTPPEATEWVAASLGRFRLAGGFDLTLLEGQATLSVQGPTSIRALAGCLGTDLDAPFRLRCHEIPVEGGAVRVLGVARTDEQGADATGPAAAIAALWDRLLAWGGGPVRPVGLDALEVLRVEAGLPRFGRDFDADTVLQEIDVPEIVSFTKGCYLGQEIVARIHYQGQPSKLLRRLVVEGEDPPCAGDDVVAADDDAKVAGRVTSAAVSPAYGPVALAMIKRKYYAPETALRVRRGDAFVRATVTVRAPASRVQETR